MVSIFFSPFYFESEIFLFWKCEKIPLQMKREIDGDIVNTQNNVIRQ